MLEKARSWLPTFTEKSPIGQPLGQVDPLQNQQGSEFTMMKHNTPPTPGTGELLKIYSKSPKMRSVVNKIASNVAKANWRVFVAKDSKSGRAIRNRNLQNMKFEDRQKAINDLIVNDEVQELKDSPVIDVLTQGNDELVGYTNFQVIQTHIDLIGEGFWLKERNGAGVPVELWPIPPHWVRELPTASHPFYRISAIGYSGAAAVEVPVSEIIYIKDPDPYNPYGRGSGIGKSLGDEAELGEFACHDEKTECLTKRGWVNYQDLNYNDEIATWNEEEQKLEYHKPNNIFIYDYDGIMHSWNGLTTDALITPNHRMWVEKRGCWNNKTDNWYPGHRPEEWQFKTSQELIDKPGKPHFYRASGGNYSGNTKKVYIPGLDRLTKRKPGSRGGGRPPKFGVNDPLEFTAVEFAKFLGYFISEGHVQSCYTTVSQSVGNSVDDVKDSLSIFKEEWVTEKFTKHPVHRDYYRWDVYHFGLAEWLKEKCGNNAFEKKIPEECFDWPLKAQISLLHALIEGDGHWIKGGDSSCNYGSRSEELIDGIQQLCIQVGWRTKKVYRDINGDHYILHIGCSSPTRYLESSKTWGEETHYKGKIWCVSVENEKLFTRRNGCVMLSGNSKYLRSFFFNRARPDIIVSGQGLSRDNVRRLEEQWLQKQQGFLNRFKPLFLSRQVDVKVVSQNLEQMQMVEMRKQERDIFFQTFGVSPEIMGFTASSNRSTASVADFIFNKYLIQPRLELIRTHLQKRLIPDFDDRLILHFDSPVKEDEEMELRVMEAASWAFNMNEWRKKANMRPKEGDEGELHLIPVSSGQLIDIADDPNPQTNNDKNMFLEHDIENKVKARLDEAVANAKRKAGRLN